MAEDIIDFGPAGAPPRTKRSWRPNLPIGVPVGLSLAGVVLAAIALVLPWQRLSSGQLPFELGDERYSLGLEQAGLYGWVFASGLLGVFSLAAVAHFGPGRPRRIAAIAGLGLSLALLVVVAALAYRLSKSSPYFGPFGNVPEEAKFALDWGLYAGVGSIVAFGLSLLTVQPVHLRRPAEEVPEPDGAQLEVRVETI